MISPKLRYWGVPSNPVTVGLWGQGKGVGPQWKHSFLQWIVVCANHDARCWGYRGEKRHVVFFPHVVTWDTFLETLKKYILRGIIGQERELRQWNVRHLYSYDSHLVPPFGGRELEETWLVRQALAQLWKEPSPQPPFSIFLPSKYPAVSCEIQKLQNPCGVRWRVSTHTKIWEKPIKPFLDWVNQHIFLGALSDS